MVTGDSNASYMPNYVNVCNSRDHSKLSSKHRNSDFQQQSPMAERVISEVQQFTVHVFNHNQKGKVSEESHANYAVVKTRNSETITHRPDYGNFLNENKQSRPGEDTALVPEHHMYSKLLDWKDVHHLCTLK